MTRKSRRLSEEDLCYSIEDGLRVRARGLPDAPIDSVPMCDRCSHNWDAHGSNEGSGGGYAPYTIWRSGCCVVNCECSAYVYPP